MNQLIPCPLCHGTFKAPNFQMLWPHIRLVHATKPGFKMRCNIDNCSRTFINMKTYDNHLSRHHFMSSRTTIPELSMSERDNSEEVNSDSEEANNADLNEDSMDSEPGPHDTTLSEEELKSAAACWILKIKETCKLTQSAMDEIIEGVTDFNYYILSISSMVS